MNNLSPNPQEAQVLMNFPDALAELIKGSKITRVAWKNEDYCVLADGWLSIKRDDKFFVWKVNDGDLLAVDWVIC